MLHIPRTVCRLIIADQGSRWRDVRVPRPDHKICGLIEKVQTAVKVRRGLITLLGYVNNQSKEE